VSDSQAEAIGARGNTVAVVIWSKQIAAARRDHKWLFQQRARRQAGRVMWLPSESQLDSSWLPSQGELFREGPRRSWKGPSQLNSTLLPNRLPLRITTKFDATVSRVVQLAQ
jgi:hypothetical protein